MNQLLRSGPAREEHWRFKAVERRRTGEGGNSNAKELFATLLLGCRPTAGFHSVGVGALLGYAGRSPVRLSSEAKSLHQATRSVRMEADPRPRVTIDKERNNLITIQPSDDTRHTASFIGPIHGLGDTNMGWADTAMQFHESMPHVKFLLPNAPISPVTLNGGMSMPSWYDITSLDDKAQQPCDGIDESRSMISELIDEEVRRGIPLSRIVVGGFSQGGAMSLYTGLQYPGQLAGVLCMSGYLAKAEAFQLNPAAASTPVAHFHGIDDPTVQLQWAKQSETQLRDFGCKDYTLKEYAGLGHGASPQEIEDVLSWLKARLPPL